MKSLLFSLITISALFSCSQVEQTYRTQMMKVDKYWMLGDSLVFAGRGVIRLDTLYNVGDTIIQKTDVATYKQVVVQK